MLSSNDPTLDTSNRWSSLRRPKSTIFASAENRMKRLTHFLGNSEDKTTPQNAPPTPPLQPEAEDFLATATPKGRNGQPALTLAVPGRHPSIAYSQMDGFNGNANGPMYGQRNYSASNLLTPGSATPTSGRQVSQQFAHFAFNAQLGADDPILQAPMAPFAAGSSRPGSRNSAYGSRPGTPGSLIGRGYASSAYSVTPGDVPKLRKKRGARKKDENSPLAWRMVAGSTASLEHYDIGPIVRGEKSTDLWFPDGDMLVYLHSKDSKTKDSQPVFRIHSTPIVFAALNHLVEDVTLQDQPKERPSEDGAFSPDDLFLEVPPPMSEQILPRETTPSSDQTDGERLPAASPTSDQEQGTSFETSSSAKAPVSPTSMPKSPTSPTSHGSDIAYEERPAIYKLHFDIDSAPSDPRAPSAASNTKKKLSKVKHTKADAEDTLQQYVDARNLFAFIARSFLVGSQVRDTGFQVLSKIYLQLGLGDANEYPNDMQASSKLFLAETHLQIYIDELNLDDVRNDDDLIVETLVMCERWRSQRLYHEAFLHACGRWEEIKDHPGARMISQATKSKLDRAAIDLNQIRLGNIRTMIPNFEFPSVWVGCGRYAEFKGWRSAYEKMRTTTLAHMKHVFGAWPPRANRRGKGGGYTELGGLNRVTLKRLYDDLACVYELCVDREWLHGERIHGEEGEAMPDKAKSMRKIMHEFDSANVPCQPEMPFQLPRLPVRAATSAKPKKRSFFSREKKISDAEIDAMLKESYNIDAYEAHSENLFVKEFIAAERAFAVGRSLEDLTDFRRGRWIFLYCVLQVLPMVIVDGVGLQHGEGVEYFLCENVKGGMPWDRTFNKRNTRMSGMWNTAPDGSIFGMGMGASTSNLIAVNPDDEIEHIYRRSHCWQISEDWRLVEDDGQDDDYHDPNDELIGYEPDGRPIYASTYLPGQDFPESPTGAYNTYTSAPSSVHRYDGTASPAFPSEPTTAGPAWAQRARQNYQPPQQNSSNPSRPGSGGSASYREPSASPQRQIEPLEIQPFQFDLSPLEPGSKSPRTPVGEKFHTPQNGSPVNAKTYQSPRTMGNTPVRSSSLPTSNEPSPRGSPGLKAVQEGVVVAPGVAL